MRITDAPNGRAQQSTQGLTDEQLEALIEYIETSLAAQAGAPAKMIEPAVRSARVIASN